MRFSLITLTALFILTTSSYAEVKTQWRGPDRDGVYPGKNLLKQWPADGPKLLWVVDGMGEGFSSAAVTSDHVFINGVTKKVGRITCFDTTGKKIWETSYNAAWTKGYPSTRSTVTTVDDLLYFTTGLAHIFCL